MLEHSLYAFFICRRQDIQVINNDIVKRKKLKHSISTRFGNNCCCIYTQCSQRINTGILQAIFEFWCWNFSIPKWYVIKCGQMESFETYKEDSYSILYMDIILYDPQEPRYANANTNHVSHVSAYR